MDSATATPAPEQLGVTVPGFSEPRHGGGLRPVSAETFAGVRRAASRAVSADSVAFARIAFGLLVAFSSIRFIANDWVDRLWLEPQNHLTYTHFDWVRPLPSPLMYLVPVMVAAAGVAIALGWHHRAATTVFLVGFLWTELIDAALYLNHYWFMTLMGVLMLALPVHHRWSLDARSGRVESSPFVSLGLVWAFRAQLGVVYFFAGLAKLNPDWLFRAQPLRLWLSDRSDVPLLGPILDTDLVAYGASWAGVAFDLTIVAWLLWRRSRPAAFALLIGFHIATGALFQIGVFPLVMTICALVFFEPDWPQRFIRGRDRERTAEAAPSDRPRVHRMVAFGLIALAAVQLMLPLRHFAEPGNARWNEDGYYLAWRVMLTEKAGFVDYHMTDTATGQAWTVTPALVLTDWQAAAAATRPDLIHKTALLIEDKLISENPALRLEVRVDAWVSMNGRGALRLIDPDVDLLAYERGHLPDHAVIPIAP